ncbi:hypothetical protein CJD36_022710 [Flavipsychrobacter stenotrophus]|uniref:Uncharacterized protein n=1 Tax=Flavipsychrobacter stenotrophus TaxID=2077091 RepID=A0A2S7SPC5_9BACT|nr:hypothetical protein [Flavipsychrobacter stenotrophus]PQJ08740.1 hypothetical protein CJD36_022710 [Flavipsychrobacter stenotrophus]
MDTNKIKRNLRLSAIVTILSLTSLRTITKHSNIRAVDMVAILGAGMCIGVLLVNIFMLINRKKIAE